MFYSSWFELLFVKLIPKYFIVFAAIVNRTKAQMIQTIKKAKRNKKQLKKSLINSLTGLKFV